MTIISLIKIKLWEARQQAANGTGIWSEIGLVQYIEHEIKKKYRYEIEKWGYHAIRVKWKTIYPDP